MTRTLMTVAGVGLLLCVVCLAAASWIGPPPWRANGYSFHMGRGLTGGWHGFHFSTEGLDAGPSATRDFGWSGGDRLQIDAPADVDYTQGPVAKMTVTGPKAELDRLVIQDGRISLRDGGLFAAPLKVVMTAPDVTHFSAEGDQTLTIHGYRHDQLDIDLAGSGDVVAQGAAKAVRLTIEGSGDGNLGGLRGEAMTVELDGSGDATIAPRASADIHIAGSGSVTLLTHPATLNTDISGSGSISQPSEGADSGAGSVT